MAEPHAPGEPVHPSVRYEPTDVETGGVWLFAAVLVVGIAVAMALLVGVYFFFLDRNERAKETDLPPVAAGEEQAAGAGPQLEEFEDVREGKIELWPPRATRKLVAEEERLSKGGFNAATKQDDEPIDTVLDKLADRLPARKERAPANFLRRLPSKASAARTETGGK
jgi:hypothetical protein